jgi:hypothetical protein
MDPAFFTVRTPRARTHQQQLACIHHAMFSTVARIQKNAWLIRHA